MKKFVPAGRLNQRALIEAVVTESGCRPAIVEKILRTFFDIVPRTLASGYPINVTNFGTWYPLTDNARTARNPQTGDAVTVPETLRPRFRWSPAVKDALASGVVPDTFKKKASSR